jgi:dipeptide/tripeptide permease
MSFAFLASKEFENFLLVCLFVFVLFFKKHFDFEHQMENIPQERHAHYIDIYVFITLFRKCKFQQDTWLIIFRNRFFNRYLNDNKIEQIEAATFQGLFLLKKL